MLIIDPLQNVLKQKQCANCAFAPLRTPFCEPWWLRIFFRKLTIQYVTNSFVFLLIEVQFVITVTEKQRFLTNIHQIF